MKIYNFFSLLIFILFFALCGAGAQAPDSAVTFPDSHDNAAMESMKDTMGTVQFDTIDIRALTIEEIPGIIDTLQNNIFQSKLK